jgi:hypothetical protein
MRSFPLRIKYPLELINLQMLIHLYTGQSSVGGAPEVKVQVHLLYRLGQLLFHSWYLKLRIILGVHRALLVILIAGEKQHPTRTLALLLKIFHNSLPSALKLLKALK